MPLSCFGKEKHAMKFFSRLLVVLIAWVISFLIIPEVALSNEKRRPFVSEPTAPEVSAKVRKLPIMELRREGDPVREFPRQARDFQVGILQHRVETETAFSQQSDLRSLSRTPDPILSFEGMSLQNGGGGWPPDTIGDVGPNHYVQMVNTSLAIFDKNGT